MKIPERERMDSQRFAEPKTRRAVNFQLLVLVVLGMSLWIGTDAVAGNGVENSLALPVVGSIQVRVLSPTVLEVTGVDTKAPDPDGISSISLTAFEQFGANGQEFRVTMGGNLIPVQAVGFKRRALYAPLKVRDLRVGNYVYLQLASAIPTGATVEVENSSGRFWVTTNRLTAEAGMYRSSPAVHVNQTGYMPAWYKKAMVGFYLGSLGEMSIDGTAGFSLVDVKTGAVVHQGALKRRVDVGFVAPNYRQVWEADFSAFQTPGQYCLVVPGLGTSFPFLIDEGVAAAAARTYALGLYHQRCGGPNDLPFTRHVHGACHTAWADIPTMAFTQVQTVLAGFSSDYAENPQHTAIQLKDVNSSLYPFVAQGKIDVSGGHHDAGDYSKYTINSAALIHYLVFAVDAFPGVGQLDNLGIPESGDGRSDLLQEAKWEADFLAKMQDTDGGFYFLVYPRDRKYEDNVLPDHGDPQIVFPKTTAATAAAVAALAQTASSPLFRQQFPAEAAIYLAKAELGWNFLRRAIDTHGWQGSYQKISHYGDTFMHDDELAWAATEMYLATGDSSYQEFLLAHFDPSSVNTFRWQWWRLFEGYGCAVRSYAFAVKTGRVSAGQLNPAFLEKCQGQLLAAGQDQLTWAKESAYGTSLSTWDKGYANPGWYFSNDRAMDMTVSYVQAPRAELVDAILSNLNYELGCNPVNVSYLTGLGWRRQREIVHQYAQNDHRVLPPSGIPIGNVQGGFDWLNLYKRQLGALTFPPDSEPTQPYPIYDRWGDSFNLTTEFVVVNQARSLASLAFLFANSGVRGQAWRSAVPVVTLQAVADAPSAVQATVTVPGVDLTDAIIVWESKDRDPVFGRQVTLVPANVGSQWVEVEAQLPDGRRVFGKTNFFAASVSTYTTQSLYKADPSPVTVDTVAVYRLDSDMSDTTGRQGSLLVAGNALLDDSNVAWMNSPSGKALRVQALGDGALVVIPRPDIYDPSWSRSLSVEAMVYVKSFLAYGVGNAPLVSLFSSWDASLEMRQDTWAVGPYINGGVLPLVASPAEGSFLSRYQWHRVNIEINQTNYVVRLDGIEVSRRDTVDFANWDLAGSVSLRIGNFDGWIDEVIVRSVKDKPAPNAAPTVVMTAPTGGAIFKAPATIVLNASASDSDGTIGRVDFLSNGVSMGSVTSAPYALTLANLPIGNYTFAAKAYDNLGASATSPTVEVLVRRSVNGR